MTKYDTDQFAKSEILVVEDNVSDLKLMSEILTKAGYRVRPADNGELALRSVQAKQPDLFLLDINLPGMSGVDLCSRLKANPETKDIPVIFISALGNAEMKVKALEAGAVDYVTKPIEPPEVLVRINTHLNMYRLQQNLVTQAEHLKTEIEERKCAENTLKSSEKRYRDLVSNLPGIVWQFQLDINDNSFSFPYISDGFNEIYDISKQDAYKNPLLVFETLGDEYREKLRNDVARSAETLTVWQDEFKITTPKGNEKWLRGASTPEILPDGNVRWSGVILEITDLKKAESDLRESESRFKAIFNESPMGVALIDSLTGYIAEVNPMFAKIAGRTQKEIVTIDWMSITHLGDIQKELDNMTLLNAGKINGFQMEKRYIHPDETVVWINMTIAPVKVEDEYHPRHLCMIEDITERKLAELKRDELIFNIRERSKELHLLYEVSKLASDDNQTWENVIQQAINLIPAGFQYPEMACVRIIIDDREFTDQKFVESEWKLSTPIKISGENAGSIEVFYTNDMSDDDDEPFLNEEYYVMDTISKHLGSVVERIRGNETLKIQNIEMEMNKKRLDALLQLTYMTDKSLEEISDFVLNKGAELTNSDFGFIGLMNKNETVLANNAWSEKVMDVCSLPDAAPQFPVENAGVWIEPLIQRKCVIINDYESTELNKNGVPDGHIPLKRLINIPIFEGEKIVALVAMANKEKEYNETDVHQLTLLLEGMWTILKRKQAEEKLKESESRLVRAQEIGHIGDWEYDVETGSIIWSAEFYHIHGIDPSTKPDFETAIAKIHPDDRDYANKIIASCIENGKSETFECRIVRPDGSIRHVYSPAEVTCDSNGNVVKVFGVTHDITERKEIEEKLKQYAKDLEHSNELKVLFADIMRHDLLNPAGIIQGYTEMLFGMEDDEKKIGFLQKIDNNNKKLMKLIESTARFARLESVEELEFDEKDIAAMFKIVVDNLRPQIEDKHITLEFKAEGTYSANVNPIIEEVFVNLLSNAIKYSPEKSTVIVDITDADENWKVAVTDFGEGVLDEHKTLLFDRFKRMNKETVKGSGLGLAIVKRIIELHGGEVGVEDNPAGVGSVFWVTVGKT